MNSKNNISEIHGGSNTRSSFRSDVSGSNASQQIMGKISIVYKNKICSKMFFLKFFFRTKRKSSTACSNSNNYWITNAKKPQC